MVHCATRTTKRGLEKLLQLKQASILSIYFVFRMEEQKESYKFTESNMLYQLTIGDKRYSVFVRSKYCYLPEAIEDFKKMCERKKKRFKETGIWNEGCTI